MRKFLSAGALALAATTFIAGPADAAKPKPPSYGGVIIEGESDERVTIKVLLAPERDGEYKVRVSMARVPDAVGWVSVTTADGNEHPVCALSKQDRCTVRNNDFGGSVPTSATIYQAVPAGWVPFRSVPLFPSA